MMDTLTIAAASGMKARLETLDLLANNIANANTSGFKADREFYDLYASVEAGSVDYPAATVPVIERNWVDFKQGPLLATGELFHVALEGRGFLVVDGKEDTLLTRTGTLKLSREGVLQTAEGYPLRKVDGGVIRLDPNRDFQFQKDGTVIQDGQSAGRIQISEVERPQALEKLGNTYFRISDAAGLMSNAANANVWQGRLEGANFGPAEHSIRLVQVMRQFEMLQRAATLGGEMNRRAVEEVARVNS